jgi:hypothetical protein
MPTRLGPVLLCLAAALVACHSSPSTNPTDYGTPGTQASFDLTADLSQQANWNAMPWPSDLRLTAGGNPDYTGFPNLRGTALVESFRGIAMQTHGFSVIPTAYFLFSNSIAAHGVDPLPGNKQQSIFLLDIDANSPQRGTFYPISINTPVVDDYSPPNLLAVAPTAGVVLAPKRTYAFVITTALKDAAGNAVGIPSYLDMLSQGIAPPTANGQAALALYTPFFAAVKDAQVDLHTIAAATIFTTGDAVAEDAVLYDQLLAKYSVTIDHLALDTVNSPNNTRVCRLKATVNFPQLQVGPPPFNPSTTAGSGYCPAGQCGLFNFGTDGLPILQRYETAPLVVLIPRMAMPAAGYPLLQYFHGSGGSSFDIVDSGPTLVQTNPPNPGGTPTPNQGPGWVHAESGFAGFGAALPVNPERLAGAKDTAYLNLLNPAAMRDTFRQGVFEQRLLLRAMLSLMIPPDMVANCAGTLPTLPSGQSAFKFDSDHVIIQGQSMGGMYTNLFGAVEPKVKLAIPTGAGGYWTYFILVTQLYQGLPPLLAQILKSGQPLTKLHPVLNLLQAGWEPNDPYIAMSRLAKRPLPGHPVRPIYEPVGENDQYFPIALYDAIALNYGHQEAGDEVAGWTPSLQDSLALGGLAGTLTFPVVNNRTSVDGTPYTGAVEEYLGDGIELPHSIYRQLGTVKYQYRCFASSWLKTGVATLSAPNAQEAVCP